MCCAVAVLTTNPLYHLEESLDKNHEETEIVKGIMDDFGDDRDETKRKSRNQSEKKRRDQFNVLVSELSSMVTTDVAGNDHGGGQQHRKMDKTTVLLATIDFLKKHREATKNPEKKSDQDLNSSKIAPEWKPPFLSNEEFVHLMLEAVDGFVLVLNLCDNGRILYASEGITWLLGHVPNALVDGNVSVYDIVAEEDTSSLRSVLSEKNFPDNIDEVKRATIDIFVHMDKSGVHKTGTNAKDSALVKLSGYTARWSTQPRQQQQQPQHDSKSQCDEHCLPPSEDESMSTRSGASSHASKHIPSTSAIGEEGSQLVFICTARLMSPQLLRDMPVVHDAKGEFTSRYSLEWKFLHLDNRAPPIIGYLPFEVLGTSGYDYYHLDDLDKIVQCHEALMQTGEATTCYHRFLTKGQQWIWLQARYFITYHQWNAKPEFVFATHHVVSYSEVLEQIKDKDVSFSAMEQDMTSAITSSHNAPPPSSPTWSSKSSVCGSTSKQSQSSCRLSGYSDHIAHISSMVPNAASMSSGVANNSSGLVVTTHNNTYMTSSGGGLNVVAANNANNVDYGGIFNNSMDTSQSNSFISGLDLGPANSGGTGEILLQAAPAMDVSGQAIQPPVFMTPLQVQMYQQLKAKHAELFKKIVQQQDELRKVSEQLLMTQYGLVPVSVAPLPIHTQVTSHAMVIPSSQGSSQPSRSGGNGNTGAASGPSSGMANHSLFGPLEMQMGYDNVMPYSSSSMNNSQRKHQ